MRAKLTYARRLLAAANAAKAHADRLSDQARELGGGLLSFGGSGNQSAKRKVQGSQGRAFEAHADADRRIKLWEGKIQSLERRIAEQERTPYTADDLKAATHVRDWTGSWHKVVRVSVKSVTVATPYSWTNRIAIDQVRDFRIITET